ncbi:MAG: CapA family protein, partial [Acidimicrobiia bacterium]
MRRVLLVGLVALTVVVIAVSLVVTDEDAPARRTHQAQAAASTTTSKVTTTTTIPRRGNGQAVTFAFGGDTHFEGGLRTQLNNNPGGMFAPIAPTLGAADIAMVNLETAIATGGSPDPKNYNFR